MSGDVTMTVEDGVAEITLDRPAKHNAITPVMFRRLRELCREAEENRGVAAVVLAGAGDRSFCAGTDIEAINAYEDVLAFLDDVNYVAQIRALTKPVVVALKGWVLGGGLELAAAADIRIASRTAQFGAPEVTLGWIGAGGTSQFLPALIGYGQAMRLLVTGDRIGAEEAHRIGLVEELVEAGEELTRARALAARIATNPPLATRAVKEAVRASLDGGLATKLRLEREMMALCFAMGQGRAGAARFAERDRGATS